jgi:hypothetical protein
MINAPPKSRVTWPGSLSVAACLQISHTAKMTFCRKKKMVFVSDFQIDVRSQVVADVRASYGFGATWMMDAPLPWHGYGGDSHVHPYDMYIITFTTSQFLNIKKSNMIGACLCWYLGTQSQVSGDQRSHSSVDDPMANERVLLIVYPVC